MTTGGNGSTEESPPRKKGWPKGRKRKLLPKDSNAPKGALSSYHLFMYDQREILKQDNPKSNFAEVNKAVAQKWAQLDNAEKQKYQEAADLDKLRYQREYEEYQKTDAYKKYMEQEEKERKRLKRHQMNDDYSKDNNKSRKDQPNEEKALEAPVERYNAFEIPIFTEEFLNHNKNRETELRALRKSTIDYEEQNAVLQKRIENIGNAIDKLQEDNIARTQSRDALREHMKKLCSTLINAFANTQLPGSDETPNESNIDSYISKLHTALTSNPSQHQKLVNQVKNIVNNLSLS